MKTMTEIEQQKKVDDFFKKQSTRQYHELAQKIVDMAFLNPFEMVEKLDKETIMLAIDIVYHNHLTGIEHAKGMQYEVHKSALINLKSLKNII